MTTIATRMAEIYEIEEFSVEILDMNGIPIQPHVNGLPSYRKAFDKRSRGSWTVNEWKEKRFSIVYPGYGVNVLKDDGSVAVGQTHISSVRQTYEDSE